MPRIPREGKKWLQFTPETKVGGWFLCEDHIVIRVYRFEDKTYTLPTFFTIRLLAMEYARKRLLSNQRNSN